MKICTICKESKPLDQFFNRKVAKDGKDSKCKACSRAYHASRYVANRDKIQATNKAWLDRNKEHAEEAARAWRQAHPEKMQQFRLRGHIREKGIEPDAYDDMRHAQNYCCAICGKAENEQEHRLSIDHDKSCCSGIASCGACVRGLLCRKCNLGIGLARDSIILLQRFISYLNEHDGNLYEAYSD